MFRVVMASVLALFMTVPAVADGGPVPSEVPPEADAPVLPEEAAGSYAPYEEESDSGFYAAVLGGAVFLNEEDIPGILEFNTGFGLLGSAGYASDVGVRVEGEFGYRRLTAEIPAILAEAEADIFTFMANALYEFDAGPVKPYVGGGVGLLVFDGEGSNPVGTVEDSASSFAWQVIGGFAVPVSDQIDLVADYRFLGTSGLEVLGLDFDSEAHNVMGGVRINF